MASAEDDCPFCRIAQAYPPHPPTKPPSPTTLSPERTNPASFIVLSTPLLLAFLDILPLTHGHLLLCTRSHREKLTDVTPDEAAELGRTLPLLSAVLRRALGVRDWNVVQNNGRGAAQVVDHVHFHLVPRGEAEGMGGAGFARGFTMFGRGGREELDGEEGGVLAGRLREGVVEVFGELENRDSKI